MRWLLFALLAAIAIPLPGYMWKAGYDLGYEMGRTKEATCELGRRITGAYPASCRDRLPAPSWPEGYQDYFDRHTN